MTTSENLLIAPREVIVIDAGVTDWKTLIAGLSPDIPVILLSAGGNGLAALANALAGYGMLNSLHLVSHGGTGRLNLGDLRLTSANLGEQGDALTAIASHLTTDSDLLIYGCSVAVGHAGMAFVQALSGALNGVDIAASIDRTGPLSLGGDWDFEYSMGEIDTVLPFTVQGMEGIDACLGCDPSGPTPSSCSGGGGVGPAPTVTDAKISISGASGTGGAYKIGDTVTATWNNTAGGDNTSGVTGVTMNFSQFGGGAAVAATNSSGTWTATYSLAAGAIDTTNRNVSVTANNGTATTTADTTNATVDSIAPILSDARISLSGASGTGGAFKIGDTVTATWNNTAGGDNNSDTIASATIDFSQFGGGAAVAATNSSGTWTATYTLTAGAIDTTNRNVSVTATDNAGNTTTRADTTNATVDSIAPILTDARISLSGASGPGGAFKIGDTVTATWNNTAGGDNSSDTIASATVNFSQFGGGAAVAATNSSGTWTASYTITAGVIDASNRNVSVTATDNAGNTTTTADTTNATVDTIVPTVTGVASSTANRSHKVGDVVSVQVNFSEAVTVTGTPQLTLETGTTDQVVNYTSGTGTSTLTFDYTVQAGDTSGDLDYQSTTALALNGGTIKDAAGNASSLTLASPGAANSLGNNKALVIDGVVPTISSINRSTSATTNAASVSYTVTFSENVTGVDIGDFTLTASGTAVGTISSIAGSGNTYTVTVSGITGDGTLRLDLNSSGTGIVDTAGNAITAGYTTGQAYSLDHTAPNVSSVTVPANATYVAGQNLDFTVNFSEAVTVDTTGGTPRVALTLDTGGTVYASYLSGSGTTAVVFRYTVQSGNLDSNGITVGGVLDASGGTLKDAAGNNATLTLNSVGSITLVLVDAVLPTLDGANSTPADDATNVALGSDIVIDFSENIAFGSSGSIITVRTDHVTVGTFTVPTAGAAAAGVFGITSISGDKLTINPAGDLTAGKSYAVQFGVGVVVDAAGNALATIADDTTYNFSTIPANAAPTIGGLITTTTINDTATATPFSSVTIADTDADNVAVSVTLDTAAKGVFTSASLTASGFSSAGGGVYNLASTTAASAQAAIRQLVFNPADNRVAPVATEMTTFTVSVNDGVNTAVTNNTTTVTSTSVNDAPTDTALSNANVSVYDGTNATVGTLSSTDADTGDSFAYSLVSGSGDTQNSSFNFSGGTLRANDAAALTAGTYNVRVRTTDAGSLTFEEAYTITVTDALTVTTHLDSGDDATTGGSYATELADGGGLSLREALALASAGGKTIGFAAGLNNQSVTLGSTAAVAAGSVFRLNNGTSFTIGGSSLVLAGGLTIDNAASNKLTLAANLTDDSNVTSALIKTGAGILELSGTNNTDTTGLNTISASDGRLQISAATNLGTDGVTLSGGVTLATTGNTLNAVNTFAIETGGASFNQTAGGHLTLSGAVAGDGLLTKTGGGSLTLSENNDGFAGGVLISNGALYATSTGENLGYGSVTLNDGTLAITAAMTIANAITVNGNGNATISNSDAVTLSGVISGSSALTKAGVGTLTLSGTNTHTGAVTVSAGTLALLNGSSVGNSSAVTVDAGATLSLTGGNETIGSLSGAGAVRLSYALTVGDGSNTTFSGVISSTNTSGIVKVGAGTLTLSGANTYTGSTTVSAGGLTLNGGSAIADTSAVTVASGATMTLSSSETIGSLAGAGNVALGANTLTAGDGTSTTHSGIISGAGGLTKTGGGALTLSGASTYTGTTTVSTGTLAVTGTLNGSAAGLVSVSSGATLGGTGTVNGGVTVVSGGNLAAGMTGTNDGAGKLTINGNLSVAGALLVDINGSATAGTSYDQVDVTGTVSLTGTTLTLAGSYAPLAGDVIVLINNDDADAVTGTFTGRAEGSTVAVNGNNMVISYVGGTGNDVVLKKLNIAPTLNANGGPQTFTEDSSAVTLFNDSSASTNDSNQTLTSLTLTVTNVADNFEYLSADGSAIKLVDGETGTTDANSNAMSFSVSVTSGTATVNLTKTAGLSADAMQTLVSGITYNNSSQNPSTTNNRVVTLTAIKDSGGTTNGGVDTGTPTGNPVIATITVVAANDAPTISGVPGTEQAVTAGSAAALADFTVADIEQGSTSLAVTLNTTNGTLNGLTDTNENAPGIQLSGTAANINTAMAAATFTATAAGAASIGISVSDGIASAVTGTYNLTVSNPPAVDPTPTTTPDTDGVPDTVENAIPGLPPSDGGTAVAGDGNGDGVADSQQSNVTSVPFRNTDTAVTNPGNAAPVYLTLVADAKDGKADTTDANTATLSNVRQLDTPTNLPATVKLPLGLISFSSTVGLSGVAGVGVAETFSLYVDPSVGATGYFKQNAAGTWVNLASAAYGGKVVTESGKTRLDFALTDGGEFDSDGVVNGTIADPGGVGFSVIVPKDIDRDQFPDALEAANGLTVGIKDNNVFTSSKFFAMQLYRDILYREGETAGIAYWQDRIDTGLSRAEAAVAFLDSPEFQAGTGAIARLYFGALNRLPDANGMSFWMDQQQIGTSISQIAAAFVASTEFTAIYGSLSNTEFIQAQYQTVMGRAASAQEQTQWNLQLAGGASRGTVLLGLTESAEYKVASDTKLSVALDYLGLLGRPAEQAGFDWWVNQQSTTVPEITVVGGFIASQEYHDRFLP